MHRQKKNGWKKNGWHVCCEKDTIKRKAYFDFTEYAFLLEQNAIYSFYDTIFFRVILGKGDNV